MSAFNPFPFISGAQEAAKNYTENRAMDDILRKSRQAQNPQEQLDIMGQVLQRLPPERRAEANEYLKERYRLSQLQGRQNEINNPFARPSSSSPVRINGQDQRIAENTIQNPQNIPQKAENKEYDFLKGDTNSLRKRAAELYQNSPYKYRDNPDQALLDAKGEQEKQESDLLKVESDFDKTVASYLGEKGNADLTQSIGELREEYLQKAKENVAKGLVSKDKAAQKYGKELLDFAKSRANLGAVSIGNIFSSKNPQRAQGSINTIRKSYKDLDRLELFEDDLVNKTGLSTGVAALVANPISENPTVDKYLRQTRNASSFNPIQGSKAQQYFTGIKEKGKGGENKRTENEMADFIGKNLKNSSINAIATMMNAKGYDADKFLDSLQSLWNSGKISLTKRQERDLQKRTSYGATLKDIAFFAETGLNPKEITP